MRKGSMKIVLKTAKKAENVSHQLVTHRRTKQVMGTVKRAIVDELGNYDGHCPDSQAEALLSGANDVVVVRGLEGRLSSTGWFAQIGKLSSLLQSREGREVTVFVNSVPARARMKICDSGLVQFLPGSGCDANLMADEDLRELNLRPGLNEGRYVVPDLKIILQFSVFLYEASDKLVLTDIDGTITESDIKGQVLPKLGITAQHEQVVQLFHLVGQHGYKVVYLTARSLAQADDTRHYLFSMLQNQGGYSLPQGPVLMNPTTLMSGLIAEVVTGNPDIQKTKTVSSIWKLFQSKENQSIGKSIIGGYGNKDTDKRAYQNSGIPLDQVYIVNPQGQLKNEGNGVISSYKAQIQQIHSLYPDLSGQPYKYL